MGPAGRDGSNKRLFGDRLGGGCESNLNLSKFNLITTKLQVSALHQVAVAIETSTGAAGKVQNKELTKRKHK